MISIECFNEIKSKYGKTSSWAIWAEQGNTPKSNVGNLDILNSEINKKLLDTLNPDVVMVGLNLSGFSDDASAFANFHSSSPAAQDFKIRYAFKDSEYWGAYMTDVIKDLVQVDSSKVQKELASNPMIVQRNIERFKEELFALKLNNPDEDRKPTIIAFGSKAYSIIKSPLLMGHYSRIIGITHYSHYIKKEKYKEEVHRQIKEAINKD